MFKVINGCIATDIIILSGGGVGDFHTKGMLIGKFKLNHFRTPIRVWIELYVTPQRYNLKQNRIDYVPLSRKVQASRPDMRDRWKSNLKMEIRAYIIIIPDIFIWCPHSTSIVACRF